tara:strand:+ start:35 stop:292 length:258 start_codon:yes stop_codon:yes gene_type:complete
MRNKKGTFKAHISTQRAIDKQSGGNHYKNLKYQVSEFILGNELNWIDANIVKYAVRNKDGESLEQKYNKIIHYAELGKELLKNKK